MPLATKIGLWFFRLSSALIALLTLRVLVAPIEMVMPAMAHYMPVLPAPVYLHIVFGPLALLMMPLQFWAALRRVRPKLHRAVGYTYVFSVLAAAFGALLLLPKFLGSPFAAAGFALQSLVWIGVTLAALNHARHKRFAQHRIWMIRSAAITFAAVTLRVQLASFFALGYDLPAAYDVLALSCWVPNLIAVELWLRRARYGRSARSTGPLTSDR